MLNLLNVQISVIIGSIIVLVLVAGLITLSLLVKNKKTKNVSTISTKNIDITPIEIDKDEIALDVATVSLNLLKGRTYSVGGGNKVKPGDYKLAVGNDVVSILHNNIAVDLGVDTILTLSNGDTICSKNTDLKLELK